MLAAVTPQGAAGSFAARFSVEATRPTADEVAAMAAALPRGTEIYITAVPKLTADELVTAATRIRASGLEPVAHIAARMLPSAAALDELMRRLTGEAALTRLLILGGDAEVFGPFADALSIIQKGRLGTYGIVEVGIGGYPEGHPRIPPARLEASLDEKIALAAAQGLAVHIVSQFSFSGERIVAWLRQLRTCGIRLPVKVGLVGPTSVPALVRFARRCGVSTSLRGLMSGTAAALVGHLGPDRIIAEIAAADGLGDIAAHYFSFGGCVETARYACDAAHGTHGVRRAMAHPY
jgi:methylenetetrahydrofolate reductase (NADPH)